MTVNPVSMVSYYNMPFIKKDDEDLRAKRLREKLESMGYCSTGNVDTDAILVANIERMQSNSATESTRPVLPWQHILEKLSLETTGSREKDYKLIMTTLEEKIARASNDSDRKIYMELVEETKNTFLNDGQNGQNPFDSMMGSSYMAQLNKFFLS